MKKNKGFTLIELLVVVAIIAVLISILLPALGKARYTAKDVVCKSNLRTVGQGYHQYAADYNDFIPPWYDQNTGVSYSTFGLRIANGKHANGKRWPVGPGHLLSKMWGWNGKYLPLLELDPATAYQMSPRPHPLFCPMDTRYRHSQTGLGWSGSDWWGISYFYFYITVDGGGVFDPSLARYKADGPSQSVIMLDQGHYGEAAELTWPFLHNQPKGWNTLHLGGSVNFISRTILDQYPPGYFGTAGSTDLFIRLIDKGAQ